LFRLPFSMFLLEALRRRKIWGLVVLTPLFLKANGSYLLPRVMGAIASSLFNLFKKRNAKPCYRREVIGPNGVSVLRFLIPPFYSFPMILGRTRK